MAALSLGVSEAPAGAETSAFVTAHAGPVAGSCNGADDCRSARRAMLEQLRGECGSEEEFDTARTRPNWTEVDACSSSSSADGPWAAELELIRVENRKYFQRLVVEKAPEWLTAERKRELRECAFLDVRGSPFFWDFEGRLEAGLRLGGGAQAEVYEALYDGHVTEYVVKVFRSDFALVELQRLWVSEAGRTRKYGYIFGMPVCCCCVVNGTLLKDDRFAFVMKRYWGDLRKVIDNQIVKDVVTCQNYPFPLSITVWMMTVISYGMSALHVRDILHRDLKAANVLLVYGIEDLLHEGENRISKLSPFDVVGIADFETSEGVMGTGFWMAPEILRALKGKVENVHLDPNVWTKKVDVYSYAMTCYEILTGCIPFHDRAANDYDGVIGGKRPLLPDYVDPEIQELMRWCWHSEPSLRPSFNTIRKELESFIYKRGEVCKSIPKDVRDAETQRWVEFQDLILGAGYFGSDVEESDADEHCFRSKTVEFEMGSRRLVWTRFSRSMRNLFGL